MLEIPKLRGLLVFRNSAVRNGKMENCQNVRRMGNEHLRISNLEE